jgi:hypothetical protein
MLGREAQRETGRFGSASMSYARPLPCQLGGEDDGGRGFAGAAGSFAVRAIPCWHPAESVSGRLWKAEGGRLEPFSLFSLSKATFRRSSEVIPSRTPLEPPWCVFGLYLSTYPQTKEALVGPLRAYTAPQRDLVQPAGPGRRPIGQGGLTGKNEAGRLATRARRAGRTPQHGRRYSRPPLGLRIASLFYFFPAWNTARRAWGCRP